MKPRYTEKTNIAFTEEQAKDIRKQRNKRAYPSQTSSENALTKNCRDLRNAFASGKHKGTLVRKQATNSPHTCHHKHGKRGAE